MSSVKEHKANLARAREDVRRMMAEADSLMDAEEPDYRRIAGIFDHMESACRSGFNNAFDLQYTRHGAPNAELVTAEIA